MTDNPAEPLDEEPQEARGSPRSRDSGSDGPSGGPVERPSGASDEASDSAVDTQGSGDDAPHLPTP